MSIHINYINGYTIYLRFTGLLNFEDRFNAYSELYEYSRTHKLRYILVDNIEMMYRTEELFDDRLSQMIKERLSEESFRAAIFTNNTHLDIHKKLKQNYEKLGLAHKLYFVKSEEAAFALIEQFENQDDSSPSTNPD